MKRLAEKTWERAGNETWLTDTFEILLDDGEYILRHTKKLSGWAGKDRRVYDVNLGEDILVSYSKLAKYFDANNIFFVSSNWYEWNQ